MPATTGQTPAYYPPGWDRERMLNATRADLDTLTSQQLDTFRTRLLANVGQREFDAFFDECYRREMLRENVAVNQVTKPPNFLRIIEKLNPWLDQGHWGFVVYRTTYGNDDRWRAFRKRWDEIIAPQIDYYKEVPGIAAVKQNLRFNWVEDPSLEGATPETVASHYENLDISLGLHHSLCLCITSQSLDSVLNCPLPSSAKRQYRLEIPFVVAVARNAGVPPPPGEEEDIEGQDWCGYFNVAIESLIDELFTSIANDGLTPYEIGGHVGAEDIWCASNRWGIHKAGIGYWNKRTRVVLGAATPSSPCMTSTHQGASN